jgi:hypothetical protein
MFIVFDSIASDDIIYYTYSNLKSLLECINILSVIGEFKKNIKPSAQFRVIHIFINMITSDSSVYILSYTYSYKYLTILISFTNIATKYPNNES